MVTVHGNGHLKTKTKQQNNKTDKIRKRILQNACYKFYLLKKKIRLQLAGNDVSISIFVLVVGYFGNVPGVLLTWTEHLWLKEKKMLQYSVSSIWRLVCAC